MVFEMRFTIQTKLFLIFASLTGLVLLGVLVAINLTLSGTIREKVLSDFKQTQRSLQQVQKLRYERLIESATLIGENSTFKSNVDLHDPKTVYFSVSEFANFTQVDLFIVTDKRGLVLARLGEPDKFGDDLSVRSSVRQALQGVQPSDVPKLPELWQVGSALYQIVTVPIYAGKSIIGTTTLGAKFTQLDAQELKGSTTIDISVFLKNSLVASTADSSNPIKPDVFYTSNKSRIDSVLATLVATEPFETAINESDVFAFVSPLGTGEPAYYAATVPKSDELKVLSVIQKNILLSALVSLAITLVLARVLGRLLSQPVLTLVEAMTKVREGNLTISLKPTTKDEIGLLTETFNRMTNGLRERMQLMKYVGSHTMEMIQKSSGSTALLGGSRQELAVLFSDIRGFTAFSENHSPEDVVRMLNHYLGFQAELVTQHDGSIDKFVGDEMVALFTGSDAVHRAVQCAIDIQARIAKEHTTDVSKIDVGIGINYGSVILGNMGATERMDYTVIGAVVNLGARLCSAAERGQILIPKSILEQASPSFRVGTIKRMSFKGISNELEIAEVLV
jgi:class 3 adenylate cyclase